MTYLTKLSLISLTALLVFSGCATPTLTPEETKQLKTKTYSALSPETILPAVSDLFFLVDDQAYQRTVHDNRLTATRTHSLDIGMTFVKAKDTWIVDMEKTPKGTTVTLDVKSEETWMTGTTEVDMPDGPAVYTQFWTRLDFLLGQSTAWMTCDDLTNEYLEDRTWGDTWWLCSEVKDRTPPELLEGTWQTREGFSLSSEDNNLCIQEVREGKYGLAQTPRQHEIYRTLCLEELGYENSDEPSDQQVPDIQFPDELYDDQVDPMAPGRTMPHLEHDGTPWSSPSNP
ncbi:hypothetical protein [Nitrospira sp. M1]